MILFYSIGCNHSKMLLDNVSRYDKDKKIKLVPIDELKKQNINIEKRIHTVPAFMILPSKEILFGKDVFDYLLLPGRGILCSSQSTRLDRNINDNNAKIDSAIKPMEIAVGENDPLSFSLNSSKISDNFSTIEETDGICNDKSYNWDFINNDKNISDGISNININFDENKKSAMPTIEQLVKERDSMKLYQYVFNQYYIDFIKRLKQAAKKMKEDNSDDSEGDNEVSEDNYLFAKTILKTIKANYTTFDKSSDEYIKYINSLPENFWASYVDAEESKIDEWFDLDEVKNVEIFTNISVKQIQKLINDNFLCHHFITVFYLFKNDLSDDEVKKYIKIFQESSEELLNEIENDVNKKMIVRLNSLKTKNIKDKTNLNMAGMEDTMLGKLAKEILEDVDIDKLQKSIGDNGDILKAIGDPNSGFSDLISNVSRKMATKISNGELKQENLLQDAMKFASIMPGMFGNQNPAGSGGPAGANGSAGSAGSGGSAGPDMATMMKMMGAMMNNKEGMEAFGNMMNPKGKKKDTRTSFNKNAYRKSMAINRLKTKLDRKQKDSE